MVVPKRELAIILCPFVTNFQSNPKEPSIALLINIEIDTPRDWLAYTSFNSSREVLTYSNILFIAYIDQI